MKKSFSIKSSYIREKFFIFDLKISRLHLKIGFSLQNKDIRKFKTLYLYI